MGLCKCPKKKVTNLFCFEHKVNVCENCLVDEHSQCIVKSYLKWLEDSDYSPICILCDKDLTGDKECVRLLCYDIFHLECLEAALNELPETTAPAGYECPQCQKAVVPGDNVAGVLASKLRGQLSIGAWYQRTFRGGSDSHSEVVEPQYQQHTVEERLDTGNFEIIDRTPGPPKLPPIDRTMLQEDDDSNPAKQHSVYQIPDSEQDTSGIRKSMGSAQREQQQTRPQQTRIIVKTANHTDDNCKYTRKPLMTHISTLLKAYFPLSTKRRTPQQAYRYFIVTLMICVLLFLGMLWLLSIVGRYSADQDPMLDPRYNPNLAINHQPPPPQPVAVNNLEPPRL